MYIKKRIRFFQGTLKIRENGRLAMFLEGKAKNCQNVSSPSNNP
jgi:hypothetical protein